MKSSIIERYGFLIALALVVASVAAIYTGILDAPFIYDDEDFILHNDAVKDLSNFWPPAGSRYIGFLSFALNYAIGGFDVFGFHLVNVVIHIINSVLVYFLMRLTFRAGSMNKAGVDSLTAELVSISSALLFAAHPIQTQAVTYVTQRFASLATLFYLLSLVSYIRWRTAGGRAFYATSVIAALFAMKTKEISFTLPFVVLFYELAFFGREGFKARLVKIAPLLATALIIPVSFLFFRGGGVGADIAEAQGADFFGLSRYEYLLTQFRAVTHYIRLLFVPTGQTLLYDWPLSRSFFEPAVVLSFLFLLSVIVLALFVLYRSLKSRDGLALVASAGVLWFFITSSVESSFLPIKDLIFEHRAYLPSVGAFGAFSAGVFWILKRAGLNYRPLAAVVLATAIVLLGAAAWARNQVWKSPLTLWQDVVSKDPKSLEGRLNLGRIYFEAGQMGEGIEEFRKAVLYNPSDYLAHYNLGLSYHYMGLLDEAFREYKAALDLSPDLAMAHYGLGIIYKDKGMLPEARLELETALSLDPGLKDAATQLRSLQ